MWTWKDWAVLIVTHIITGITVWLLVLSYQERQQVQQIGQLERCVAAQTTILDEAERIAAGGKFPGEAITDRWKKLLGGCND